jgi:DNA-binding LacI/PurR family transcriptional regulator
MDNRLLERVWIMRSSRSRISIRDVAERAGVSECTVSKVLGGSKGRVSDATRAAVQRVADEIGYRPNRFAKLLSQQRTYIVGVVISCLENPVYAVATSILDGLLQARGYQALFEIPVNNEIAVERNRVLEWPVDGFLVWATPPYDITLTHGPLEATPLVTVGIVAADGSPSVAFDMYGGGVEAARHLLERGYRRIAHVFMSDGDPRTAGFVDTLRAAGVGAELIPVSWDRQTREEGLAIGAELAARVRSGSGGPDAVFCHNDLLAVGVHRGLRRAGVRVPEDVAVIGFDGIPEGKFLESPLTSVEASMEALCAAAVDALINRIEGKEGAATYPVLVPVRLVVGGTS